MKKYLSMILIVASVATMTNAQTDTLSSKPLQFGFLIGADYSSLQTPRSIPDTVIVSGNMGLRLGVAANYAFSKLLSLSAQGELSFNNARVSRFESSALKTWKVFPASIDLRMHATFTDKNNRLEPYFFIGPGAKIPLAAHVNLQNNLNYSSRGSATLDVGIGINKPFHAFRLQPELRYSFGLNNLSNTPGVRSMYFHTLSLLVKFMDS